MNSNPPGPQVVDSQNTADHITTFIIEHQDLPYRIAVLIQDGCRLRSGAFGLSISGGVDIVIKIEDLLDGSYRSSVSEVVVCIAQVTAYRLAGPAATWLGRPLRQHKCRPGFLQANFSFQIQMLIISSQIPQIICSERALAGKTGTRSCSIVHSTLTFVHLAAIARVSAYRGPGSCRQSASATVGDKHNKQSRELALVPNEPAQQISLLLLLPLLSLLPHSHLT